LDWLEDGRNGQYRSNDCPPAKERVVVIEKESRGGGVNKQQTA
jgi:hypothetical protein